MTPQRVELVIERLSQGGEGVAHHLGHSVFVEGAFPGDRVLADVALEGKVYRGRHVQHLQPGPSRRTSPCPVSDACGGCDWLELDDEAQLAARQEIVLSALEHLGGVPRAGLKVLAPIRSPQSLGYRRRAVFHADRQGLGLFRRGSHELIHMERCPALVGSLSELPHALSETFAGMLQDLETVELLAQGEHRAVALRFKGALRPKHREVAERCVRNDFRGVVLVPKEGPAELVGKPVLKTEAPLRPDVPLYSRPDAFTQANAEAGPALVERALACLGGAPTDAALELYAGNGYFTFALAQQVRSVVAVEGAPISSALAQRSAAEAKLANVRFIQGDVGAVCRGLISEGRRFDVLLADPPRTGALELGTWAHGMGVRRLVYIACDASSLARDARSLRERGLEPSVLQVVDMFPQTRHVEAILAFERRA